MTIWIGNTTRQDQQIEARLPEMGRVFMAQISSGRQCEIKDLSPSQEEGFIRHIQRFGAVSRKDLHGRVKTFTGLVYATDKPLKMDEFHYGLEEVLDHAQDRSIEQAVRSAQAADLKMRQSNGDRISQSTEIEMVEEKPESLKKQKRMKLTVDPKVSNTTIQLQ